MRNADVDVHYVTRIEGHGNIVLNVRDGRIEKLEWQIPEAPRFFEAMLRGRRYDEAADLSCRICGICSCGHRLASLQGMEAALGVQPSEQTVLLRKLLLMGEEISSHVLHVCFLVLPDLMGAPSVIPLAATHPEVIKKALKLKHLGNEIGRVVAGRHIHALSAVLNGFTKLPAESELRDLKAFIQSCWSDLMDVAEVYASIAGGLPKFTRETEYLSLQSPDEYAFYDGDIVSSDAPKPTPVTKYRSRVKEHIVDYSSAKHARSNRPSYMVGALARFNCNHEQLHDEAKQLARKLGLTAPCHNPFMNTTAQLVETVHCVKEAIILCDKLLERGLRDEERSVPIRAGLGAAAVEVPRGTLYHEYAVDPKGIITDANLVIPTGQNHANIEQDMHAFVPQILDKSKQEITRLLEMLVRAYDPCVSCSTHLLNVQFV
jgi:coenzyme F420-reducing hydrogenase alpha subunit